MSPRWRDVVVGVVILKKLANQSHKRGKIRVSHLWTDDEVDLKLLLSVILEYKVTRTTENVDWETCQSTSKYSDILDLFIAQCQYPSPKNAIQLGKEFPH
jgi:hypothetical protein